MKIPKKNKLWDLYYRGNVVSRGTKYPVLVSIKNKLIKSGTYQKDKFTTKFHGNK
jgi:hypothetical protein